MPWVSYGQKGETKTSGSWQPYGTKKKQDKKKAIIEENLKQAEKYQAEAEKANSFKGIATETAKGVGRIALGFGKEVVRMPLTVPLKVTQTLTEGVTGMPQIYTPVTGVEKFLYGEQPRQSYLQDKVSIQKWGQGKGMNRGSSVALGALGAGGEIALDLALPGFGKAIADSFIGKAMKNLSSKVGIGNRTRVEVNPTVAKSTVDEIVGIVDRDLKPEEEQAVMESLSRGATKEEIVTEVGKAKVEAGFDPSIRLAQVVDDLEAGGKKLSLDEISTVKKGMDEGKSFEEIKNTLEPQKSPSTSPKEETGATVPKDTSDNGDEAFLKAVEERFKASKTNKFREATKDEKGRFTGSKSEARMKTGDPERDALSESIQTRIDNLGKDELNKTTEENFYDTSQRLKLEDIQNQIPKAKAEELPRLKEESDRIIKEILDKRAGEFKATSKKEDIIQKARTVANKSNSSLEFRTNLRKEGLGKAFKSQQAAEEFYRRMNGAKYRLADEEPLIQEAGKYESAEEFVNNLARNRAIDTARRQINVEKNLKDLKDSGVNVNDDGTITLFAGMSKKDIKNIGVEGFRQFSHLTTDKNVASDFGDTVFSMRVMPEDVISKGRTIASGDLRGITFQNPVRMVPGNNGIWEMSPIVPENSLKTVGANFKEDMSQLTDIWKKAHGEKFRDIAPRFEELTGTKITPEQEAQIKSLHKRMFGDENVEITAQILTPEGQKAFGVYKNKVIKILDGQVDPTDTFYHEAVHKYLDLFTTMDEQKSIYLEARKLWKTDNLDELEEKIAENFIRYAKENEGVVGTMKVLFDKVIDRIKNALKGESKIEALYKDILEGKAKKSTLTSKELQKRTTYLQKSVKEKEREMDVIRKGYMSEERFLAEPQDLIFDETIKSQYDSFAEMLRKFRTGRQREAILSGDVGSIKKALDGKVGAREIDDMFYSQEKSDNEMLDYFRGIYEKGKKKVTNQDILSSVESKLKTDPDYIRLQDELGDIRKQQENLAREEEASIKSVNESLDDVKKEVEPIQKTKEATPDPSVKQVVPKGKKVSIIASRLNEDLPPDFRIDETYDPKAINKEADKAAELIAENKTKAIQKALDTGTNPMERDAILIELSEIAKRDKDYGTLNDLFNKRSELIRSGAQSLNMEKASILLNPQEQYMRNVVNAKLGKVKINGKDLKPEELVAKRTGIRKEAKDVVRKSFKIEDAQELFDKLLCK